MRNVKSDVSLTESYDPWLFRQHFYHGFLPRDDLPFVLKKRGDFVVRAAEVPQAARAAKKRSRDVVISVIAMPDDVPDVYPVPLNAIRNIIINVRGGECYIEPTHRFKRASELFVFYSYTALRLQTNSASNNNNFAHPHSSAPSSLNVLLKRGMTLTGWEFRHSNIKLHEKVGQGAYGEVFRGQLTKKNKKQEVAIKMMKGDSEMSKEVIREMMAEARLMRMLNHPNIVRIRGVALLEQPLYIVLDFIHGGGLDSYLKKNGPSISTDERCRMSISAAWGLQYLHLKRIIHRDIAARNCLYDDDKLVKLSDFGLSRSGSVYKMRSARRMPIRWMAPESIAHFVFSHASDVFSFGNLLYEIFSNDEPYQGKTTAEAKALIMSGKYASLKDIAPEKMVKLVSTEIHLKEPEKRSHMNNVVSYLQAWLNLELDVQDEDDKDITSPNHAGGKPESKRASSKLTTTNTTITNSAEKATKTGSKEGKEAKDTTKKETKKKKNVTGKSDRLKKTVSNEVAGGECGADAAEQKDDPERVCTAEEEEVASDAPSAALKKYKPTGDDVIDPLFEKKRTVENSKGE